MAFSKECNSDIYTPYRLLTGKANMAESNNVFQVVVLRPDPLVGADEDHWSVVTENGELGTRLAEF